MIPVIDFETGGDILTDLTPPVFILNKKVKEIKMQIKLAEALLRRKELQDKVLVLKQIKDKDLFEVKARRQSISDSIDDIVAQVPKLTASQVTSEYDWHARQLRLVDAAIQQANWTTEITVNSTVMADFT